MHATRISDYIIGIGQRLAHRETTADEAELNDRAYEGALLELQLRYFLRAEYGGEEPPPDVLPQILRAIHLHEEATKRGKVNLKGRLAQIVEQASHGVATRFRGMAGAGTGRIISGGLVTALLMLATWPNMMQVLSNGDGRSLHRSNVANNSAANVAPAEYPTNPVVEQPTANLITPAAPQRISPGLIYEQPRLLLEQKTGEDLGISIVALDWSSQHATGRGVPSEKTAQPQVGPGYTRPLSGPE